MDRARQTVTAPGAPAAIGPYSHAVRTTGELLFCSGQIPLDPASGELVGVSAGEQARRCLENLRAVCAAAGTALEQAVRVTIYMTNLGQFSEVNEVCAEFFPEDPPARVTIGVAGLPRGAQVEIDAVVALGSSPSGGPERESVPSEVGPPSDPAHVYHVELRHFPRNLCHFNMSGEELQRAILEPWAADRMFDLGDLRWDPRQARLTILEGPRIPPDQLTMGRGWSTAKRQGADVTAQLLVEAGAPRGE